MHIRKSDNKKNLIIIYEEAEREIWDNNRDNGDISSPRGKSMPE